MRFGIFGRLSHKSSRFIAEGIIFIKSMSKIWHPLWYIMVYNSTDGRPMEVTNEKEYG